ncbi:hypothetical protein GCM10020221_31210 [Streptomyces thioluteus]|uniref:Uncharacterized protein n=1 Tax=Streptomyces thioluteus TaxID=66431 RepID=A0ABN3X0Y6_STRTU
MTPRPPARRARRTLLAALVAASVAVPVAAEARPSAVPAPAPTALPSLRSVTPPPSTAVTPPSAGTSWRRKRAADAHGDHRRAAALEVMAGPGRHFLSFDGRDGGRSAEVVGDLSRPTGSPCWCPVGHRPEKYGRLRAGATASHGTARRAVAVRRLARLPHPRPTASSRGAQPRPGGHGSR